jgi:hypothetical protein
MRIRIFNSSTVCGVVEGQKGSGLGSISIPTVPAYKKIEKIKILNKLLYKNVKNMSLL